MTKTDSTRYQILYTGSSRIDNFTAREHRAFLAACKALRAQGVAFTTWDTRRNALASLFRF